MNSDENTNQSLQGTSQSDEILQSADQSEYRFFNSKEDDSDTGEEESETYYFESDHTALKGNHDYQMMLRAIAKLESQRIQVYNII